VPAAESFEALNARLEAACLADLDRKASGQSETIGSRLEADLAVFRPLPSGTFEACEKRTARVSSTSLVRYRTSDYSVPTTHGFRDVMVKGFVDQVVIICDGEEIARHKRSHERGAFVCDPLHYLALIERKPGALDQARPLQGWPLPEQFEHLRRLLEARMGNRGKREFIQVLRLMEVFDKELVAQAVKDCHPASCWKHASGVTRSRFRRRQATDPLPRRAASGTARSHGLSLSAKPNVGATRAADYAALLQGTGCEPACNFGSDAVLVVMDPIQR
jgi:hypothetical protein